MESDPSNGDPPATLDATDSNGAVTSADSFDEWFHDLPGVNLSIRDYITLRKQADDTYLFDDATHPEYSPLGGFFPIDGRLYGNEGDTHNHHFTYTIRASFTYDASAAQFLESTADADVWVFVDDQLAIDLDHLGREVKSSDFLGKCNVMLLFYPLDWTPT